MKIQEFSFGNFKSFKNIQTLNLAAAKIKSRRAEIDKHNVIQGSEQEKVSFLKSKAIYGANASGKSNVIKAFSTFIAIVRFSVKDEQILHLIDSFKLSTETETEPTFFQIIFWDENTRYRYGFELDNERITAEWLYGKPKDREQAFFIRDRSKIIELDKTNFSEGNKWISIIEDFSEEDEIFRDNSLFISTLASFGFGKISKRLIDNISSIIIINGLGHQGMRKYAGDALENDKKKKYIVDFLKYGDIGIEDLSTIDLSLEDLPLDKDFQGLKNKKILISTRKKYDEKLNAIKQTLFLFHNQESEGTQKLLELSPYIYDALKEKRTIIIDEFDARFHPLLTRKILGLFNAKENIGAQFIFTTHDTNLLSADLLRRDQIEFIEKDKYGASHLYSLVEFKGIRNTASFEKDYFQGKYGAIPFLGDFSKLINPDDHA